MTAIVIRENAKAPRLTGIAGVRATPRGMVRRATDCAAATVLACAVGSALLQLAAELVSFPTPVAVTAMTVMAMALLNSLRRHIRIQSGHWNGALRRHDLVVSSDEDDLQAIAAAVTAAPKSTGHDGHLGTVVPAGGFRSSAGACRGGTSRHAHS